MLQTYFLVVAAIAGASTLSWLFIEDRISVTAFVAFAGWTLLAVFGGSVEVLLEDGTRVDAAVPSEVRWLLFGLALVSFLALTLYQLGVYPPDSTDPYHDSQTNA